MFFHVLYNFQNGINEVSGGVVIKQIINFQELRLIFEDFQGFEFLFTKSRIFEDFQRNYL